MKTDSTTQMAPANGETHTQKASVQPRSVNLESQLAGDIEEAGGPFMPHPDEEGAIGRTMYDTPVSQDHTVTVLLPPENIDALPSQSLVRIKSRPVSHGGDGRNYLGVVSAGPFAEPDGLRADAPLVVTTTVRGATFLPRWHGRVQVQILGEEIQGTLHPPRFRPRPNSPVFALSQKETAHILKLDGNVTVGVAVGYEELPVCLTTDRKDVYFRHVGVLGTTGSGKSTDVALQMDQLNQQGVATVIFDTEGEYTHIMEATDNDRIIEVLTRRGQKAHGLQNVGIYHLIGRDTRNPTYKDNREFCLELSAISRYVASEILGLNEAQDDRFQKAYDITRRLLMDLKVYPANDAEKAELLELDELEQGFPRMTLQHLYDVVRYCADQVANEGQETYLKTPDFHANRKLLKAAVDAERLPKNVFSWRKVQGNLARLLRLGIFDNPKSKQPDYDRMTQPGQATVIDLSDTDSPQINNLVISQILRGLQLQQEDNYRASEKDNAPPRKVVVIIEEAHEFLSRERIGQMQTLFAQVARIARRGRKRWLALMFATQLPQHLPDEVLGLINNFFLHKLTDANVISRLRRSVGGIDEGLWNRVPNLAPGQAIVASTSFARPLLVALDPAPCKLLMADVG
jgi:DNA helicase HerA-like ATPase